MSDVRVVLIGGSGFVGSNLRKHIATPLLVPDEAEADLTQPQTLRKVIQPGDVIINAAGYANATDATEKGRALFQAINIDGVRNLAQVAVDRQAAQLIHISSVAAMGRWHQENVTEDMLKPTTIPYATSKRAGEGVLAEYHDKLPITILRPTSVFGESRGLARTLCGLVSRGIAPMPDKGSAMIPFSYVGNVARCVELTIRNSGCYGQTYIIGDEQSYLLKDILAELGSALQVKVRLINVPIPLCWAGARCIQIVCGLLGRAPIMDCGRIETLTTSVSYSISAFQAATGYRQPYSFSDGINRIAEWYKKECLNETTD